MTIKRMKTVIAVGAAVFLCTACGGNQPASPEKNVNIVQTGWEQGVDQSLAGKVKPVAGKWKSVTDVHAVNTKKDLMVAIQLKPFDRFNAQQITQKIQKQLQKKYPKVKVQVSSDKKIFAEIADLEKKLKQGKINRKVLDRKIKRINRFMKDQDPSKS